MRSGQGYGSMACSSPFRWHGNNHNNSGAAKCLILKPKIGFSKLVNINLPFDLHHIYEHLFVHGQGFPLHLTSHPSMQIYPFTRLNNTKTIGWIIRSITASEKLVKFDSVFLYERFKTNKVSWTLYITSRWIIYTTKLTNILVYWAL